MPSNIVTNVLRVREYDADSVPPPADSDQYGVVFRYADDELFGSVRSPRSGSQFFDRGDRARRSVRQLPHPLRPPPRAPTTTGSGERQPLVWSRRSSSWSRMLWGSSNGGEIAVVTGVSAFVSRTDPTAEIKPSRVLGGTKHSRASIASRWTSLSTSLFEATIRMDYARIIDESTRALDEHTGRPAPSTPHSKMVPCSWQTGGPITLANDRVQVPDGAPKPPRIRRFRCFKITEHRACQLAYFQQ